MLSYTRLAAVFAALSAITPAGVEAQDPCPDDSGRGPLEVTPASGGANVTLGAPVRVRYSAGYFDDPSIRADPLFAISVARCEDAGCATSTPIGGRVQVVADVLFFQPDDPFEPRAVYSGIARGVDFPLEFNFRTGASFDSGPPVMGEIAELGSARAEPSCDLPDGGYRIDVSFPPARDDGPEGDIEYLLFLTRGPDVDAPQLRARQRNFATDLITMAFTVDPAEAVSPICVAVHAVDGVGNIDDDGQAPCFDPIQGNFFEPLCGVASPGARGRFPYCAALLGALFLLVRRRRRTPKPSRGGDPGQP